MSHKTHSRSKTENKIYDNKENCSFEIIVLFVFIEIIRIDREERHSKTASTDSGIFWEEVEKDSNKYSCPNP